MWLRDILQARHTTAEPVAAAPASSPPISSQVAPVAGTPRGFRMSAIGDEDATQRSAGVPEPELTSDSAAVSDDARPTIGRFRESGPLEPADLPEPGAIVGGTYRVVSELGRGSMG